jgi:phage-related minor tail protein
MADNKNIEEVGLRFKADGSVDFQKSITAINRELNQSYAEFRKVTTSMDENSTATDRLKAKQDLLQKQYELQGQKVNVLSKELEALTKAEEKDEDAIAKKRLQLTKAETTLGKYQNDLKATSEELSKHSKSLDQATEKLNKFSEKTTEVGKKASVASAAVGVIGGVAIKSALEVEASNNKMQAQLGLTADEMEKLKRVSEDVFKNAFADNIGEANRIVLTVRKNLGDLSENEMTDLSSKAATIAQVFEIDINEVMRSTVALMKNFGLSANDAFNYITWGFQNNLDFSGEFLDSINEYSVQFSNAGFSANEMFTILKSGADAGAFNLDKVGDAAKEFGLRITDGSKTTDEAMKQLSSSTRNVFNEMLKGKSTASDVMIAVVNDLKNMKDQVLANQIAVSLFGGPWEDLTQSVGNALGNMDSSIINTNGKIEELVNTMSQGVGVQGKEATNSLNLSLADLGATLLDIFAPALTSVSEAIKKASDWFMGLDNSTKNTIATIGIFIAIVGPLLLLIGTFAGSIFNIIRLFTIAGPIVNGLISSIGTGLSGALKLVAGNPVMAVVAAIGALILLLMHLWNTNEDFRNAIIGIWENIKSVFSGFSEWLGTVFSTDWSTKFGWLGDILNSFLFNIQQVFSSVQQIFGGVIDFIAGIFTGNWERAWQGVLNVFGGIFNGLSAYVKSPLNTIIGMVNAVISGINGLKFPSWVPGVGGLGISIPKIPFLANGAYITKPTVAMVGEGNDNEIVAPEKKLNEIVYTQVKNVLDASNSNRGDISQPLIVQILLDNNGLKEIGRAVAQIVDDENGFRLV